MDIQKEREVFEAWVGSNGRSIERFSDGSYKSMTLDKEWGAWQAAKAQAVPEWISVKDRLPPNDPYNREYWVYETLNNKVQHDYWVCPDISLDQDFEPFFNNWIRTVTHWMPMVKYPDPPMKPQQPSSTSGCLDEP